MTLRRAALLLVGLFTAATLTSTAAAASFHIIEAGAGFPDRAFVLTLPHGVKLGPGDVIVRENGEPVNDLTITAVGQSTSHQFGALLVIDASTSMEGRPERAAFAAASAFAAQRKGMEQLALMTYDVKPTLVLGFTTDQQKIDAALLNRPAFVFGTHIYDAVDQALQLITSAHIKAASIVLLSDGQEHRGLGDTAGHQTEEAVAAAARAAHVRVFTIGLRSRLSKLAALKKLASDTGGRYIETTSIGKLQEIYSSLGSQLANEYLIRYRSLAGPGKHILVTASVNGLNGVAGSQYDTPQLQIVKSVESPYKPSRAGRIWRSSGTMALIVLLTAALIGFGVVSVIGTPQNTTIRRRMAEFVSVPSVAKGPRPTAQVTAKMLEGTSSLFQGNSRWEKWKWELRVAGITLPAEQIIVLTVLGTIVMGFVVNFITSSFIISLAFAVAVPLTVRWYLNRALLKVRQLFAEQLPDNLQVLSSALRAGHSFVGALSVVVNDAPEPAKTEFSRVVADEQLGVPIEDALRVVVERMDNRELEQVALVAALQRETGGNTAEVLDRVTDTIRERFELRRTVQTLTAQGRLSRWVLTLLPIVLLGVITLVNPGYINILYQSTGGKVLLVMAGISVAAGSVVIKRIVDIKV